MPIDPNPPDSLVRSEKTDRALTVAKYGLMGIGGLVVLSWVLKLLLNPFLLVLGGGAALLGWALLRKKPGAAVEQALPPQTAVAPQRDVAPPAEDDANARSARELEAFDRRLRELDRLKQQSAVTDDEGRR